MYGSSKRTSAVQPNLRDEGRTATSRSTSG